MDKRPRMILDIGYDTWQIYLEDIYFIEKEKTSEHCWIYTVDGRYSLHIQLKELYRKLLAADPAQRVREQFVYATRSIVVNTDKIIRIDRRNRTLYLKGGFECPYTRIFVF